MNETKLANTSDHTSASELMIAASSDGILVDIKAVEKPKSIVKPVERVISNFCTKIEPI